MHLKRLEVVGFKSFAKKVELDFNTPITAIVGPNGSGKSNVAESFRFVLGEQSVKSMRGKRTEDLIWNGSQTAPRANRASVKLTFDNPIVSTTEEGSVQRLLPIDFDTVTIERVIHRDSSSEYMVNGSVVRLKDIVELLSAAHIGASGHHIISQGEADRVLSVNSRERKAMIEDALGLKIYHYKKEESLRKLEKTHENIEKAESLRREIKPHIAFLSKQVAKLEKAQELAETLTAAYQEYFSREKSYIEETTQRLEKESTPLRERAEVLERDLAAAKKTLAELETQDEKSKDVVAIEEQLKAVEERKNACALALGRIEGEIAALARQREREEKKIEERQHATVSVSVIEPHLVALERILDEKGNDVSFFTTLVESLRNIARAFRGTLSEGIETAVASTLREIDDSQSLLVSRKSEHEADKRAIDAEESALRSRYAELQHAIEDDRTSSRDAERAVFAFSNELSTVRVALERVRGQQEALRLIEEEYKRELGEAGALIGRTAVQFVAMEHVNMDEPRSEQEERKKAIERMKVRLEDAGIAGADEIMREYQETQERDAFLEREIEDLRTSAQSLTNLIADLEKKLFDEFTNGLGKINKQFSEFFGLMFGGGEASLKLVTEPIRRRRTLSDELMGGESEEVGENAEEQETQEGVEIDISLPRKKVRSLEMLSGGERALTSIALIFAMSQVNPPPFIILDETDAALDEANSKRYGDMIENLAKKTQLILITHNRETMSRAGVLYGVTMGRDAVSQLLSVSFTDAVQVAK